MSDDALTSFTRESFAGHIGATFHVHFDETSELELKLTEANSVGGESDHRDPFSVIFVGPLEPVLPQAIYTLMHEDLGTLDLFLVPVGPDRAQTGIQYEAVFT